MNVSPTNLPEILVIEPQVFADARGNFSELWVRDKYAELEIDLNFVQDNFSHPV